ncbi:hypothetical protein [Kordia sp.]|uniref:hypothetical protein n=1 Tax=Kordia sp. TaxID=1965332 RepID=UPI003D29BFF4
MENFNDNSNYEKQRHGCVTAWLVFIIIANSLMALLYLLGGGMITENLPGVATSILVILGLLGVGNVIFAVLLLQWKKIGFWGFLGTSIVVLFINISIGLGIGQSLFGLVGVAILYGILQIKQNDVTAWENLE